MIVMRRDDDQSIARDVVAGDSAQSFGLAALFHEKRFGLEKAQHRGAFLSAPVEVEGNRDRANLGDGEQSFEMLGAAAHRDADQVAFADTLVKQVVRQPVSALM